MSKNSYPWEGSRPFNDYPTYIRRTFGQRVQKLSINAGFTCPNRDGSKSRQGCTFCNETSFRPSYCKPEVSITDQLDQGMSNFRKYHPDLKFMAYFQSFSNTYADVDILREVYQEALKVPDILGLVIGTRPDCVSEEALDLIEEISKKTYVTIEFGIESTNNRTLEFINRHHTFEEAQKMIVEVNRRGIHVGAHIILGLPKESKPEMLDHARALSELPLNFLKIHQLQILKQTVMARQYADDPTIFTIFELDEYIDFIIDFLEQLSSDIVIERFISEAPREMLIAPRWGLKNHEIVHKIESAMLATRTFQGRLRG